MKKFLLACTVALAAAAFTPALAQEKAKACCNSKNASASTTGTKSSCSSATAVKTAECNGASGAKASRKMARNERVAKQPETTQN